MKGAAKRVTDAIENGRKPGMPLSILANIAREAPLGSLLAAFLLGVAFARRRWSANSLRRAGRGFQGRIPNRHAASCTVNSTLLSVRVRA